MDTFLKSRIRSTEKQANEDGNLNIVRSKPVLASFYTGNYFEYEEQIRLLCDLKNYEDRRGCYLPLSSASTDKTLLSVHNSFMRPYSASSDNFYFFYHVFGIKYRDTCGQDLSITHIFSGPVLDISI